jgi:hypothetical protein
MLMSQPLYIYPQIALAYCHTLCMHSIFFFFFVSTIWDQIERALQEEFTDEGKFRFSLTHGIDETPGEKKLRKTFTKF